MKSDSCHEHCLLLLELTLQEVAFLSKSDFSALFDMAISFGFRDKLDYELMLDLTDFIEKKAKNPDEKENMLSFSIKISRNANEFFNEEHLQFY